MGWDLLLRERAESIKPVSLGGEQSAIAADDGVKLEVEPVTHAAGVGLFLDQADERAPDSA